MISIIIPVYNIQDYLNDCVETVFNQTYTDFELILVDDGSTDNSKELCDNYKKKDNRVIVIHKKNGGLSSARNAGLDIAKGEYIYFLDGDDKIPPNCLYDLINNLMKTHSDMCVGNYNRFGTSNKDAFTNINWKGTKVFNGKDIPDLYLNYGGYFVVAWNKLYKKEIFNNLRYDEGKLHEDEFLAHKLWKKCNKIACISNVVYNYRFTPNSIMNSKLCIKHLDFIEAYYNRICSFRKDGYVEASQKVEYLLWKLVIDKYFKIEKNGENEERFIALNKLIKKCRKYFLVNPMFSLKEKISICIFLINPMFYKKIWG